MYRRFREVWISTKSRVVSRRVIELWVMLLSINLSLKFSSGTVYYKQKTMKHYNIARRGDYWRASTPRNTFTLVVLFSSLSFSNSPAINLRIMYSYISTLVIMFDAFQTLDKTTEVIMVAKFSLLSLVFHQFYELSVYATNHTLLYIVFQSKFLFISYSNICALLLRVTLRSLALYLHNSLLWENYLLRYYQILCGDASFYEYVMI